MHTVMMEVCTARLSPLTPYRSTGTHRRQTTRARRSPRGAHLTQHTDRRLTPHGSSGDYQVERVSKSRAARWWVHVPMFHEANHPQQLSGRQRGAHSRSAYQAKGDVLGD